MDTLLARGYTVMLETGGHRSIARVPAAVVKIVDVKCPGSGESGKNDWDNLARVGRGDEVKFVIAGSRRLRVRARRHRALRPGRTRGARCCISPVHGVLDPRSAVGMDARRPSAGAAAVPAAQADLAADDARGVMDAVVLLSGGLDSYTAAAIAKADGFALNALTVHYGQRHAQEIDAGAARRPRARRRAASRAAAGPARDRRLVADVGRARADAIAISPTADIPSTYVPARNTIFLSLALGWAEVLNVTDIVIGVNALDYSGYPDCRPEFIAAFETAGDRGDAGRRRRRAVSRPHAAHRDVQGGHHPTRAGARPRLRLDAQLLRLRPRTDGPADAATAACFARKDSPKPASPTRC